MSSSISHAATRVLIVGAGGHGQVVADVLFCMWRAGMGVRPIGFVDDNAKLHGRQILGLPVFGNVSQVSHVSHDALVVAIGINAVRAQLFEQLNQMGEVFVSAVHPSAVIASDVHVGDGCIVCANAVINTGASIGNNTIINTAALVEHHNQIASHVHIAPGVKLAGNVSVGEGSFVGIGSTVLNNLHIGEWSTVGAGAVVTKDIEADQTVVGVPARPLFEKSY